MKALSRLTFPVTLLLVVPAICQTASEQSAGSSRIRNIAPEEMWKRVEECVFPARPWAAKLGMPTASSSPLSGTVDIGVVVAANGEVANQRVLSGPPLLASSAVEAIRQWKFRPQNSAENRTMTRVRAIARFNPDATTSIDLSNALLADDFDDPGRTRALAQVVPRPAGSPDCDTPATLIYRVDPDYPAIARLSKVQGTVIIDAVIAPDGTLQDIKAVAGPSSLTGAAQTAVKKWRFTPYLHNGKPTPTKTQFGVNFGLSQK